MKNKNIIEVELILGNIGELLKVYTDVFNEFLEDENIDCKIRKEYKEKIIAKFDVEDFGDVD